MTHKYCLNCYKKISSNRTKFCSTECKDRFHNKRRSQNLTVARLKYLGCSSQDEYNAKVSAINTERDEDNAERDISWDAHNCHTPSLNDDNDDDSDAYILWHSY